MAESIDTIAAIATPIGIGGLGVIRVSGPQSKTIVSSLAASPISAAPSNTLQHGFIVENGQVIDEVVFSIFTAPHSFTGEDVVEISCHGSPVILKQVLRLCVARGARLANPGEFTERAFINGKLDLIQAEAIASLIGANSDAARIQATHQLRGVLSQRIKAQREIVLDVLASIEANLDFIEEQLPPSDQSKMTELLAQAENDIRQLLNTSLKGRILNHGINVALVGSPNAGKSSLFNALLAHDRAIVTEIPGTTRDTLEGYVEWNSYRVTMIDTAGLRNTSDIVEELGLKRTHEVLRVADVVLYVIDASQFDLEKEQRQWPLFDPQKTIVVFNKIDLVNDSIENAKKLRDHGFLNCLNVSALKNEGLSELQQSVIKLIDVDSHLENQAVITQLRHQAHLEKTLHHLQEAKQGFVDNGTHETIALELRAALRELGAITGQDVDEDVLGKIFAQFCIGK